MDMIEGAKLLAERIRDSADDHESAFADSEIGDAAMVEGGLPVFRWVSARRPRVEPAYDED